MHTQEESREADGLRRALSLSDGVFAIAMTLLAFNLRLPPLPVGVSSELLMATIHDAFPNIIGFVIAFHVIGVFWMAHQRMFAQLKGVDRGLLWRNHFYLLTIAFLPFSASLIQQYGNLRSATIFFAITLLLVSLASNRTWAYVEQHLTLVKHVDSHIFAIIRARSHIALVVFALAVLLAWFSPIAAQVTWISLGFVNSLIEKRRFGKKAAQA